MAPVSADMVRDLRPGALVTAALVLVLAIAHSATGDAAPWGILLLLVLSGALILFSVARPH